MSREEAAVTAVEEATGHWAYPVWSGSAEEVSKAALEAADQHDAANGIHRIALDDATVERAAKALADEFVVEDSIGEYDATAVWGTPWDITRAVIAAIREGSGE